MSGQEVLRAGLGEGANHNVRSWTNAESGRTLIIVLLTTPKSAGSASGSLPGSAAQLGVSVSR